MDNHRDELKSKAETSPDFVPPRHWIGPEELDASYWSDAKNQEKRSQEFFEKPIEYLEKIDKSDQGGIVRRDFLTLMSASLAMTGLGFARRPVHKIIPYVVKPEEITPGVATWYASTCGECSSACGILAKDREGRPIKLEGNPDHPLNQGRLCARGQASLLSLYDPDRLRSPMARSRTGGASKEVTWTEVDAAIQGKLKAIAAGAGRVRVLTGHIPGDSTKRVIADFLSGFKNSRHVQFEPLDQGEVSEGQDVCYGTPVTPDYRYDAADVILSLGADFLGTWLSPVENAVKWVKGRKLPGQTPAKEKFTKLITFEPHFSITGADSDERYPIRPGDELKVALAIAHELLIIQKRSGFANDASVTAALGGYTPDAVATEIGIEGGAATLKNIATTLWNHRGKSLVIGGGIASKTQNSLALQIAVNLLNSVLDNEGATVDGTLNYSPSQISTADLMKLVVEMKSGQVDALIIHRSNPAYTLPKIVGFDEALKQVPLVIVVAEHSDETAQLADFVLPDHHFLENWGDASPKKGLYSLQQPTLAPIYNSRAFQDSLLSWTKGAGLAVSGLMARSKDWHEYLQNHWKEVIYRQSGSPAAFEQFWEGALRTGVLDVRASQGGLKSRPTPRTFRSGAAARLPKYKALDPNAIYLALYPTISMHDGRSANNAWLQELPHPLSSVAWDNYVNVGPALAKKLGIKSDEVVEIRSGDITAQLPVFVQPGMHPNTVSVAVGYGRRSAGKVGDHAGVDVFPFITLEGTSFVFSGHSVTLPKTGKFYQLAATQWHTATENRPIINDITLAEYQQNPAAAIHTDPHLRLETVPTMWPPHEYKGHRWGMAIDLTTCIGCSACVIACQVENNTPVVGRSQVRVSRQMHWLRIDRYYSGTPENPEVVFQPMLCQHCENAPCETVCPVLATVHDDEGLNVQVYNRCVGTRYCQNNCPYKVRRFNFFDHWKSYEESANLVWNPDVTVRTRGIMEKCTFCIQRIRSAKDIAKDAGDRVRDGDVKTACQQTCPTDAIIFGDINDPNSQVSRLKTGARDFRVLEVLNTKPVVSYLSKVRNKAGSAHQKHPGNGADHA